MRRLEGDEFRHAAGEAHQGQVGVVHGLEQHHLVPRLHDAQDRARQRLRGPGGHHHLARGVEVEPLPAPVMGGNRRAQLGNAHHGGILVVAVEHRLGRRPPHVLGTRIVREALPQIDRARLAGQARHHLEDGGGQVGEKRVHRLSSSGASDRFVSRSRGGSNRHCQGLLLTGLLPPRASQGREGTPSFVGLSLPPAGADARHARPCAGHPDTASAAVFPSGWPGQARP
jgi:hypothetical protein